MINQLLEDEINGEPRRVFLEELIFEVSYPDIDLCKYLAENSVAFLNAPLKVLEKFTKTLNIEEEILKTIRPILKDIKSFHQNISNKHRLFKYWIKRLLVYSQGKVDASTVLCLHYEDLKGEVVKKIWYAQLKTIFPLIEEARIRILKHFQKILGNRFVDYVISEGISSNKDLDIYVEIEFTGLIKIARKISQDYSKDIYKIREVTTVMREIRNDLAHLKTVNRDNLEIFFNIAKGLKQFEFEA